MYKLIGIRVEVSQKYIGGNFEREEYPETVALFSTREKALEYIKKSKLKQPKRITYGSDVTFKKNSLLRYYESAEVEEHIEEDFPVDPEIDF